MAITKVQMNVLAEMQDLAKLMIALKSRARNVVEMYVNENISTLTDADIQSIPPFAGVSVSELQGAKGALDTVATAIGEYTAGTPATKLIKIVDVIPIQ
jgi:hypothetical protein